LVSGNGSNLQVMIDAIDSGDLKANIVSVVSNNPDAYALERAKKHKIPVSVLPYNGKFSDKEARKNYEKQLTEHIEKVKPDLIQLAGWNFVLGDTFLNFAQKHDIPVINQHPALLSTDGTDKIRTSQGIIPVIRGKHVINEPFLQDLPVSGFSVHQLLPGDGFDMGPVILTAEVHRHPDDTAETWGNRIKETENLFIVTAVKRILHVMQSGIDVSKGTFPWGK
jgi:phosphoribosylglycinamide formyltransferase 1